MTITVDPSQDLGPVVTGGGTSFSGVDGYVPAAVLPLEISAVAQLPYRLNRVAFDAEVADSSVLEVGRDTMRFPQPAAPPAAWDFGPSDGVVSIAKQIRDQGGADFLYGMVNTPTWMTVGGNQPGTKPADNNQFATYCARHVAYYNKGSFVDDNGRTVSNPAGVVGIKYWEIWNEPDINNFWTGQPPAVLSPDEYAELFKVVRDAMKAVDPTIQVGGPTTSMDPQPYVDAMSQHHASPDFVGYDPYPGDMKDTDEQLFAHCDSIVTIRPGSIPGNVPVIVAECNSIPDGGDPRTTGSFATPSFFNAAYQPLFYTAHVNAGTWRILRWETVEHDFRMIDGTNGALEPPYYAERAFWSAVREGARRILATSSSPSIACLAVKTQSGKLDIVAINRAVASPSDKNGAGLSIDVTVTGTGASSFALDVVDRDMNPSSTRPLPLLGPGPTFTIDGYGLATLVEQ